MKKLFPFVLLFLAAPCFAQSTTVATSTRAKNGKLVSLSNIQGLSDCETKNFTGEVRNIDLDGDIVRFELWDPKEDEGTFEKIKETIKGRKNIKEKQKIELNLDHLAPVDRAVIFHDMIRKSFTLRAAGYACKPDGVVSAFSLDLVY